MTGLRSKAKIGHQSERPLNKHNYNKPHASGQTNNYYFVTVKAGFHLQQSQSRGSKQHCKSCCLAL